MKPASKTAATVWGQPLVGVLVASVALPLLVPAVIGAENPATPEYKIKAGFLYNFAKLCEWPAAAFPTAATPVTIGVLGNDSFGPLLDETLRDHTIDGRAVVVRRYDRVEQVRNCHVLFVSRSEQNRQAAILRQLGNRPILTVGETPRFAAEGGIIQLFKEGERVRFEINLAAAERARLQISAKLIRLAHNWPATINGEPD